LPFCPVIENRKSWPDRYRKMHFRDHAKITLHIDTAGATSKTFSQLLAREKLLQTGTD